MKHITLALRAVLLITVFAACSGGTFTEPGHWAVNGGSGGGTIGGGGGGGKPAELLSDASLSQAKGKVDEIISYCRSHPGAMNTGILSAMESLAITLNGYDSTTWYGAGPQTIVMINSYIRQLQ